MQAWTYIPSDGGTAPETWRAGTSVFSVTERQTAHSSADNGIPSSSTAASTNSTGSTASSSYSGQPPDRTNDRTENCHTTAANSYIYGPASYHAEFTGDTSQSIIEFHHFTISLINYTDSTIRHERRNVTANEETGDTTGSSGYSDSSNYTFNSTTGTAATGTTTHVNDTFTANGATTFISSYVQTVGIWTASTISIATDTDHPFFNPNNWTTSTSSFEISTNATQPETSSSTWTITQGVTQNTTATTSALTTPVTYAADQTTINASTLTSSDTAGSGTYTVPVTNETVTYHAFAQKVETVALMHAGRSSSDFNLGDMLWWFTLSSLGESDSTTGRFSDLFSSNNSATVTFPDFEKYTSNAIEITAITVSQNTVTSTTSVITATGTGTGTGSTGATVVVYSKNGAHWALYETCTTTHVTATGTGTGTGSTTGISAAASNTSTVNHTFSIGDVSTSESTYSYFSSVISETVFYHTFQVTGYETNNSWTSSTETAVFASSSFSETRLALWASTTTSINIVLRSTTTDIALIDSYSSYLAGTYTAYFNLGRVSTATTRVYSFATTTAQSLYASDFNNEVDQWTTATSYTLLGGGGGETSAVLESFALTNFTKRRALPQIRTTPDGWDAYEFSSNRESVDRARFSVLPNGYAGFGGTFEASAMAVNFTVEAGLTSGSAFSGQSIQFGALPSVLAYPHVTLFPTDPSVTFGMPGAARASYISSLSSIGTASVAVTWTSTTAAPPTTASGTATTDGGTTTTSGITSSKLTSQFATYTLAGVSTIGGTYFSEEPLSIHSEESFQLIGGYGIGDNNLGHPYTVFARSGYAQWTEYSSGQSTSLDTFSTSGSNGTVSFTVSGNKAIVFQFEPLFTANWTGAGDIDPFYFSSTPHVRFE